MKSKNLVAIAVYLGTFCGMFMITARSIILPTVLAELDADKYYDLAVLITSLAMCVVLPVSGKLSDFLGRKRIFIVGSIVFIFSSLLCTLATSIYIYMLGLTGTGIAFDLVNSVQLAILNDIFSEEERTGKVSNLNIANSLACLIGPIAGGAFTDCLSWRSVYISVIPILVAALIVMLFYKEERSTKEKVEFNVAETVCYIIILIPAILLMSGKKIGIYHYDRIIIGLIISVLVGIKGLFYVEKKTEFPVIPYFLFKNKNYLFYIVTYLLCSLGFAVINYLPLYYQKLRMLGVTVSGLLVVPRQLSQVLMGMIIKREMKNVGTRKLPVVMGFVIFGISMILMLTFDSQTELARIVLAELLFGFGYCALTIICQSNIQLELPEEHIGSGTALIGLVGALGNTMGAAIGSMALGMADSVSEGLRFFFLINAGIMICGMGWGVMNREKSKRI